MFGTFSGASAGTSPSALADTSGLGKPHAVESEQPSFKAGKPNEQQGTKPKKEGAAPSNHSAKESHDPSDGADDINSSALDGGGDPLAMAQQNPSPVEEKFKFADGDAPTSGDTAHIGHSGTLGVGRQCDRSGQTGRGKQNLSGNPTGFKHGGLNNQRRPDTLEQGEPNNSPQGVEQAYCDTPVYAEGDFIGRSGTIGSEEHHSPSSKIGHRSRHGFDNSDDVNPDGGIFDEMAFQAIGESRIGLAKCGHPVSIEASCAECEKRLFGWAKDIKDNMPDSGVNPPPRRI